MHSRLNIPAPAGVKNGRDAQRKVSRQSNAELRALPEAHHRTMCREKPPFVPPVARTVNRHRWVSRVDSGAREKPLSGTRQNSPVTSGEGVPFARMGSINWV